MFEYFFRVVEDAKAPNIPMLFVVLYILSLVLIARHLKKPKLFAVIAIVLQVVILFWYNFAGIILHIGLPLYHCRVVIWLVSLGILFNKKSKILVWLSLLGIPASIMVLLMRDMHLYQFPHITNFYYFLGHGMIFLICVCYLDYYYESISIKEISLYTVVLHLIINGANIIFKANYAYLTKLPLINNDLLNNFSFLIITLMIIFMAISMREIVENTRFTEVLDIDTINA